MMRKLSVVLERDQDGCYAWCPELKGCHSQGATIEEALANIHDAAQLFLETLTAEERSAPSRRVILTTAIEVQI
jgi:predicted RNase H-like HicB family nuclease